MKLIINGVDFSEYYINAKVSGAKDEAARRLEFNLAVSGTDPNLSAPAVMMEDEVKLYSDDMDLFFSGNVYGKSKSIQGNSLNVICYDKLLRANRSVASFSFDEKTPAQIAETVFGSLGISPGKMESGSPITRVFDNVEIYTMALIAYRLEFEKTGKPYLIRMNGSSVDVVEKGKIVAEYQLDGSANLFDSDYSESIEDAVSSVKLFDKDGNELGEVKTSVGIGGSAIYREEEGEDSMARAEAMLKGIERTATVRVLGNFELVTGNAVMVKEPYTGLVGKFYIDGDTHIFEKGIHITELKLSFENTMAEADTSDKVDLVSSESGGLSSLSSVPADGTMGSKVLAKGESIAGTKYLWGGNNPSTGIDCTGFVDWAYTQSGYNIPGRLTSASLRSNPSQHGFVEIPFDQRQPGDVLWQQGHVAMQHYGNKIIESGGVSKKILGYSGVATSNISGRTFSKAYRYVGG